MARFHRWGHPSIPLFVKAHTGEGEKRIMVRDAQMPLLTMRGSERRGRDFAAASFTTCRKEGEGDTLHRRCGEAVRKNEGFYYFIRGHALRQIARGGRKNSRGGRGAASHLFGQGGREKKKRKKRRTPSTCEKISSEKKGRGGMRSHADSFTLLVEKKECPGTGT